MTKFFVYTSNKEKDKDYEFVEADAIEHFATHEYDPNTMLFSDIAIEAEDFDAAMQIYQNPACGLGEYMLADEPYATTARRAVTEDVQVTFNQLHFKLQLTRCMLLMKLAASKLVEANEIMNRVCHQLYQIHGNPAHMTPDMIFDSIAKNAVNITIKYNGEPKKP